MKASNNSHFFILRPVYSVVFLAVATVLTILRRPDAFLRPQFFAEDGHYWYAQAYQLGKAALFLPSAGYLQTSARLVANLSLLFPMKAAPLIFNVTALVIQLLPVAYLLSARFRHYPLAGRLALSTAFLLFTNTAETFLNLTNAQWYLGLTAFLTVAGQSARTTWGKVADTFVLIVAGLSGPFSLLLVPITLFLMMCRHLRWSSIRARLIFLTAGLQALTLLQFATTDGGRFTRQIGFSLEWAFKIFARQVVWGAVAGPSGYNWLIRAVSVNELLFVGAVAALLLIGYAVWRANRQLQALVLFAVVIFISTLLSPTVYSEGELTVLQVLFASNGIRYWLIPMAAIMAVVLWSVRRQNPWLIRALGLVFIGCWAFFTLTLVVRPSQLRYPAYFDYDWAQEVERFQSAPGGTSHMFRLNPPGWQMTLIKK